MPASLPLSVAIVCKDNAPTIGRTLDSVRGLCREIVAIDSGSTDGTLTMLHDAGARVIASPWLGHIKTKQLALESCTHEWVLSLDSDESPDASLIAAIRGVLEASSNSPGASGFEINRITYYKGRPLRHVWQPEWRLRLVRKNAAKWGGLDPHDKLQLLSGNVARLQGSLRHDSFPTFAEHLRKQYHHASTMAHSLHNAGVRTSTLRLLTSPAGAMLKQLVLKRAFLDGVPGWLASASTASAALVKHAIMLELQTGGDESARDSSRH